MTISETRIVEEETDSIDSTLHVSDQRREKMKLLYHMNPIVNKNYINTRNLSNEIDVINTLQHKKMKQYSKGLKPEQLFRCPKDSRSKRRKCCGGKTTDSYFIPVFFCLFISSVLRIIRGCMAFTRRMVYNRIKIFKNRN